MSIPNIAALEAELRRMASRECVYDDLEEDEDPCFEDGPAYAFDSGLRAGEILFARQLLSLYFTGK